MEFLWNTDRLFSYIGTKSFVESHVKTEVPKVLE